MKKGIRFISLILALAILFTAVPFSASAAAKEIWACSVMILQGECVYDGTPKQPKVSVSDGDKMLAEGVDYLLSYSDNINAGYAAVTVTGIGNYTDSVTEWFAISSKPLDDFYVSPVPDQVYTGRCPQPQITVRDGETVLQPERDYYLYCDSAEIGDAVLQVILTGNYYGERRIPFKIVLGSVSKLKTSEYTTKSVSLTWGSVAGADGYEVYSCDAPGKNTSLLADVKAAEYKNSGLKKITAYHYRVRAYKLLNGKKQYSGFSELITAYTRPDDTVMTLKTGNKKAVISWKKRKNVDGYEVYRATKMTMMYDFNYGGYMYKMNYKRIASTRALSFKNKKLSSKKNYYYKVCTYKTIGGVRVYGAGSNQECTADPNSRLNYAKLKSRKTVKVISTRKDVGSYTMSISNKDRKIMKAFAKKHFKKGMSRAGKVSCVLQYIHNETDYIKSSKQWNKIGGKSYVYDIFKLNLGQCAQYNGAFAAFLAYLGYDARLICGYRGTKSNKWSHYWCEVKIDGVIYLMDAYNKKDGNWWFMGQLYSEADGRYIKNGKNY